jgi:hypothetical protein
MNKTLVFIIYLWNLLFSPTTLAMEPDEESLRDPKFVAEYDCSTEHFLIRKYFENEQWNQAIQVIDELEKKGYSDRFLTASKAKVYTMKGEYNKALVGFQKALGEDYKCKLTIPKFKFSSRPDFAREAILWHYISQVYGLMRDTNKAASTQAKSEELLLKSLGLTPEEEVRSKENTKITLIKIFSVYNLFQKPLIP